MSELDEAMFDRERWGPGPWQDEPDRVQWVDEATDLDCLMVRNGLGAWCGYVGVPPAHPLHGADPYELDVTAHWGLNYGASCEDNPQVCHVPEPGREPHLYWLGFDCGHAFDLVPGFKVIHDLIYPDGDGPAFPGVYRDVDYVREVVRELASQLHAEVVQ